MRATDAVVEREEHLHLVPNSPTGSLQHTEGRQPQFVVSTKPSSVFEYPPNCSCSLCKSKMAPGNREWLPIESTIQMAKRLQLITVAEGVETAEQLAALTRLGCDVAQGHMIARPMPVMEFMKWMERKQRADAQAAAPAADPNESTTDEPTVAGLRA